MPTNYDSPWKECMYQHPHLLLSFLFPKLDQIVDWSKEAIPLETELRKLMPEGEIGVRHADALIRVKLFSGDERILHGEVQAQGQDLFPNRVFTYNYRTFDSLYSLPETLVILADKDPTWLPNTFEVVREYGKLTLFFEPVKLITLWGHRKDELRKHKNPPALFVLAHLEGQRTDEDDDERERAKLDLLLNLAGRKLEPADHRHFERYLDWLLYLPPQRNRELYVRVRNITLENHMPFVSIAESYGRELGQIDGLLKGLRSALRIRFQAAGESLMPAIQKINAPEKLSELLSLAETASLDDIRTKLASFAPQA